MIIKRLKMALLGCLALVLIQCNSFDASQAASSTTPQPNLNNDTQMNPTTYPTADPSLQNLIDEAKSDLAQRLEIPIHQIILVEAKEVVWPDSSLGCPQPGMVYKQVPEDGALIILQVSDKNYEYHIGGNRGVFLCEKLPENSDKIIPIDITKLTPSSPDKNFSIPATPEDSIPPGEDQ